MEIKRLVTKTLDLLDCKAQEMREYGECDIREMISYIDTINRKLIKKEVETVEDINNVLNDELDKIELD